MKKIKKVAACVTVLGIAVALSACAPSNSPMPAVPTTSTSQPSSSSAPAANEESIIANRLEEFLQAAYTVDSAKADAFYAKYENVTGDPTDEEKQAILADMVEVLPELSYVDVEGLTTDEKGEVYAGILGSSTVAGESVVTVHVPEDAVTVSNTEPAEKQATVDVAKLEISLDGVITDSSETDTPNVTLVLKNGTWMINHEAL